MDSKDRSILGLVFAGPTGRLGDPECPSFNILPGCKYERHPALLRHFCESGAIIYS